MKTDSAATEARANPQAYACLGLTFASGLIGIFFAVFLNDLVARVSVAAVCLIGFIVGVAGHSHFKKKEIQVGFRPSSQVRRLIGYAFGLSIVAAAAFAVFAVVTGHFGYIFLPVAYSIGIFPFVRRLLSSDEKLANQSPLPTPASGTPAAGAPVEPPPGTAGR
jgi:hypothetical protein